MFKNIIYIFIYIILFSLFMNFLGASGEIVFSNYNYLDYSLFVPTIIFLILLYLSEKTKDDKLALKYGIGSVVLAVLSWGAFFVYNSLYIW